MRGTATALAAVLTAALTGCAGEPSTPDGAAASASGSAPVAVVDPTVPPVPGMAAEAVRLRTDEAVGGQFQVRITDTGDQPFTVTSVALDSAGFTPLPATGLTAEFAPRRVIDLPTPYGAPICSTDPEPASARLTVVRPGGVVEQLKVPLAGDVLGRIHERECAVLAVGEVVDIAVTGLRTDGDAVTGALTLSRRTGDDPVTVARLGRSVLIEPAAEELPLELAGEEARASTPVSFTPASCDPHVLAETKKSYVFVLDVRVGDDDAVPVPLPLDQEARDLLAAMVSRVCLPG